MNKENNQEKEVKITEMSPELKQWIDEQMKDVPLIYSKPYICGYSFNSKHFTWHFSNHWYIRWFVLPFAMPLARILHKLWK
jgi:hypothetical protein